MIPIAVDLSSLNFVALLPILTLVVGALAVLIIDLIRPQTGRGFHARFSFVISAFALALLLFIGADSGSFFDLVLTDGLAVLGGALVLMTTLLFLPLSVTSQRFHEFEFAEYFALVLLVAAGFMVMMSTNNLILIFLGLETASLPLYTLIAMHNRDRSTEAAIKYFTMGALAAGFFAFGAMVLYLVGGSLDLSVIFGNLQQSGIRQGGLLFVGFAFLMAALGFKLSLVPFHTWTPDVYEGASAPLAGYMSVVPKIAGFIVAMRVFESAVAADIGWVRDVLWVSAVLTMTVGNVLAIVQESVKRMLAFSSISHAGFGMVAVLLGTTEANATLFLYWTLFAFANFGAFTMLWVSRHKNKIFHNRFDHPYTKFSGMVYINPIAAIIMAIYMLSLAGIPPFALFWGKFSLILHTLGNGYVVLALIMVLNSAIASYYYLKLIVYMFLRNPSETQRTIYMHNVTPALKAVLGIAALATVFSIFMIESLLGFITEYLVAAGY